MNDIDPKLVELETTDREIYEGEPDFDRPQAEGDLQDESQEILFDDEAQPTGETNLTTPVTDDEPPGGQELAPTAPIDTIQESI